MTTPADWYPDPENPAGLRYWDGIRWTEHRAPAPYAQPHEPEAASAAHRAEDTPQQQEPEQPYDTHPRAARDAPEPAVPPASAWDAPMPSWDEPTRDPSPTEAPDSTTAFEAPPLEASTPETPTYETSSSYQEASPETPTYQPPSYAAAPPYGGPPSYGPPGYGTPPPADPSGQGINKKLVAGILGGAAIILIAIIVVVVLVVVHRGAPTVTSSGPSSTAPSSPSSESPTASSPSESATAESPTPTPVPTPGEGSDGDYTFSVAGTETGDTITSSVSDSVQSTADGVFYVVYANVANTGTAPLTFTATFQQLNAAGTTYPIDDEATAFLDGTTATIAPGAKVETPLVFDVPVGTTPDSVVLHADPSTPGVTLPLQ